MLSKYKVWVATKMVAIKVNITLWRWLCVVFCANVKKWYFWMCWWRHWSHNFHFFLQIQNATTVKIVKQSSIIKLQWDMGIEPTLYVAYSQYDLDPDLRWCDSQYDSICLRVLWLHDRWCSSQMKRKTKNALFQQIAWSQEMEN